ncbi:hypothetical protein EV361DRAFT_931390 [Lentinula raphanica]|nr:hypothetical protein EV361DRAFT_931390 [Lentinula raphanica]
MPSQTTFQQTGSAASGSGQSNSNTSALTGAVIGGLVAIAVILLCLFVYRRRKRKAAKLLRFHLSNHDEQSEEDPERRVSALESSVTHDATVLSANSRSAERLLQPAASVDLAPHPRSVVPISPTSLRPTLPPLITKELPAIPPPDDGSQSAVKYTRNIFSAVSLKRFTTSALKSVPISGSTESATSSFFPKPIHDEDRGILTVSRQQSLRDASTPKRMSAGVSDPTNFARTGTYPGASNAGKEIQEPRLFPVRPIRPPLVGTSENVQPPVTIDVTRKKHQFGLSVSPQSNAGLESPTQTAPAEFHTNKGATLRPLKIIPETNTKNGSVVSEENNSSPNRSVKRLSEGKIRVEKEKQRRRRPKTPVTSHGPRPRPLPSPPTPLPRSAYNTPLSSASSTIATHATYATSVTETMTSEQSGTTASPLTPSRSTTGRRRRPLPPTSPEARKSFLLGSHILVPLKGVHHGLGAVSVHSRAREISALIHAQTELLKEEEQHDLEQILTKSQQAIFSSPLHAENESNHLKQDEAATKSNVLVLPSPPSVDPLPPITVSDSTSHRPTLRARSGQPEYSLSLPSTLPSHFMNSREPENDVEHHSPNSTSSRGPLPPTPPVPLSAHSAPDVDSGNRSPRRLPPRPQRLQLENSRTETRKEILELVSDAQYLTVPVDLNLAPPPYSGRRAEPSKVPPGKPTERLPAQGAVQLAEPVSEDAARKAGSFAVLSSTEPRRPPQNIPVTPSEWRTSSAAQSSITSGSIGRGPLTQEVQHHDDTAADMLFELLDDAASASMSSPDSPPAAQQHLMPTKSGLNSSVYPPARRPSTKTHSKASSEPRGYPAAAQSSSVMRNSRVPLMPASTASASGSSTATRPLSIPKKTDSTLSVSSLTRRPSNKTHNKASSEPQNYSAAVQSSSSTQPQPVREAVTRIPRIPSIPEHAAVNTTPSKLSLSHGPPSIPPHPITSPPQPPSGLSTTVPASSMPLNPEPRTIRSKLWNAKGVNSRNIVSSIGRGPVQVGTTTSPSISTQSLSRSRSNSAPNLPKSQTTQTIYPPA